MTTHDASVARFLRVSAAVLLALWLMLGGGVAAATATTEPEPGAPLLSITVQNSAGEVQSGDEVTYTAVLENLGTSAVEATVVLTAPDYVTLTAESADAATVEGAEASWVSTVEGNSSAEFTIDAVIDTIPDTERRVTTVVSVFVGDPAELIVRTADAASIVGVDDVPGEQPHDDGVADDGLWLTVGLIAAGVLVVVLLIVTVVAVRAGRARRRKASGRRVKGQ